MVRCIKRKKYLVRYFLKVRHWRLKPQMSSDLERRLKTTKEKKRVEVNYVQNET